MKSYMLAKRKSLLFIIILISIYCTGCMSRVDIQKLSIVMGMGIDVDDSNSYKISFQVLQSGAGKQDSSRGAEKGAGGGEGVLYYEGIGETVFEAMGDAASKMSKSEFYGQLKIVVIGNRAAERGIASIVDFLGRFNEIRASIPIYVTKGTAASIMRMSISEDTIPVNAIDEMVMNQIRSGRNPVIYMAELLDTFAKEDRYPILGVINLSKKTESAGAESFIMDGIAAFDGDKLINYLSTKEIEGYQYIMGKVDDGSSVVKMPSGSKISLEILETKGRIRTEVVNGKPEVSINISQLTSVREMPGNFNPVKNPDILEEIGKLQSENIRGKVEKTLRIVQNEIGKDIIDIGGEIHRHHPKEWKNIKENWKDIFPYLDIEINVDTRVRGTGLITKPPY